MSSMLERAASALLARQGFAFYDNPMDGGQDAYDLSMEALEDARAVIKAMREPTQAMLDAAAENGYDCIEFSLEEGEGIDGFDFKPAWQAMIDEALASPRPMVGILPLLSEEQRKKSFAP
jgi:hypothetical protein